MINIDIWFMGSYFLTVSTNLPMIENITIPANIDVAQFVKATMRASLVQLLFTGLYDAYAIKPPNANPNEKKICVPASSHTTGSANFSN